MNTVKRILTVYLLILTASCGGSDSGGSSEGESGGSTEPRAVTTNNLNETPLKFQSNQVLQPLASNLKAEAKTSEGAKAKKQDIKRPNFRNFFEGGKILKKVKTHYINDNSWLVLYQTQDEFPELKVILLTPDVNNDYQKIRIDTFNYDGAIPQVKELFFANVDKDLEKELIILCTWEIKHQGLGINATDYKVSIYDNKLIPNTNKVQQLNKLMDKFGTGIEGEMEETTQYYQWKDKASILKALEIN